MFLPPINLGSFKPSPATLAQWVYDIWQYLQENPIATQEQLQEYIATFITTSPETQELIGEGVEQYLLDNPPQAPVQSVQGKTGAVTLNYPDIVPASNAVPVYRAAAAPNTSTAQGLYNNGYRLFANTATQEIYTISNAGALSLVGRGKFDGTTVDLNTSQGDTTIAEAITELTADVSDMVETGTWTPSFGRAVVGSIQSADWVRIGKIVFARTILTFGTSSETGNVYIDLTSLPYNNQSKTGVFGTGRTSNDSNNNLILSTGDANNNVWITTGAGGGLTGVQSSGKIAVFGLWFTIL